MTMSEKPRRHAAMASGCAWERRTSGPEKETPISARVRTSGARRSVLVLRVVAGVIAVSLVTPA